MVKGGKKTNIGYMYSVMDELQRLRESNAALTEKNRDLAKQLNVTKMELAQGRNDALDDIKSCEGDEDLYDSVLRLEERKQMQAVLADHVRTWIKMSKRTASTSCHATVQCDLSAGEEVDDTATEMTSTGRATPPPRRISLPPHDSRRSLSPTIKIVRRELLLVETRTRDAGATISAQTNTEDDDVHMRTPSPVKTTATSPDLTSEAEDTVARSLAPQFEEHRRRLRHRTHEISYIEPPLNRKIRRGDYYGLIKRSSHIMSPRSHMMRKRRQSSNHATAIFSLAEPAAPRTASPITRVTRPRKPVSYVLPKLNTKLRQGDKFTFTI